MGSLSDPDVRVVSSIPTDWLCLIHIVTFTVGNRIGSEPGRERAQLVKDSVFEHKDLSLNPRTMQHSWAAEHWGLCL